MPTSTVFTINDGESDMIDLGGARKRRCLKRAKTGKGACKKWSKTGSRRKGSKHRCRTTKGRFKRC